MHTFHSVKGDPVVEISAFFFFFSTVSVTAQSALIQTENRNNEAGCARRSSLRNTNGFSEESACCLSAVCAPIWLCAVVYKWVVAGFPEVPLNVEGCVSSVGATWRRDFLAESHSCWGNGLRTCHFRSAFLFFSMAFFSLCLFLIWLIVIFFLGARMPHLG